MATRTQTRLARESALFLLVLGASLVLLNLLGFFGVNLRADATSAELFSLSKGSKRLAGALQDQMEIRAYFSKDLPPPYNAMGRYIRDLLTEYRDASHGKITLRMIEPQTDEDKQAAEHDGVDTVKNSGQSFAQDSGESYVNTVRNPAPFAIPELPASNGILESNRRAGQMRDHHAGLGGSSSIGRRPRERGTMPTRPVSDR